MTMTIASIQRVTAKSKDVGRTCFLNIEYLVQLDTHLAATTLMCPLLTLTSLNTSLKSVIGC